MQRGKGKRIIINSILLISMALVAMAILFSCGASVNVGEVSKYTLTLFTDGNGTTSPSGSIQIAPGVLVNIRAYANQEFGRTITFDRWDPISGVGFTIADINSSVTTITLSNEDVILQAMFDNEASDFTAVTATPDNHQVTLQWDDVPLTESYTLYYRDDGVTPGIGDNLIDDIESPYIMGDLDNGYLYSFRVVANGPEGEDRWSNVVQAIPLSPITLAPTVVGEYGQIRLEWNRLEGTGTNSFIVKRATEADGTYVNISGVLNNEYSYTDTDVDKGQKYFYKIVPATQSSIESACSCAETAYFPPNKAAVAGAVSINGRSTGVAISGNYAYVTEDTSNKPALYVIDISNPRSPEVVGSSSDLCTSTDVAVSGTYAYVSAGANGPKVIDIDPESDTFLQVVGDFASWAGYAMDIAVSGNYAYIANWDGLRVVNITNPENPVHDSEWYCETGGVAYGVAVSGDYAYVADGTQGLKVIDISTPTSPSLVNGGVYDTASAYGVTIQGDYAYIADGNYGIVIVDVSPAWDGNPSTTPTLVGSIDTNLDTNCAFSVSLSGTYAYVADGLDGVTVIDVSNPVSPQIAGGCDTYYACDIVIKDGYAYIADNDEGFRVIDIAVPGSYTVYGPLAPGTDGSAMGVDLFEDVAFVASGMAGLEIIDVSEKDSPAKITTYDTGFGDVNGIRIGGNTAVVYDSCPGEMKVLDISTPSAPGGGDTYGIPGISDAVIKGDYAIVDATTFKILDISEPSSIEQTGSVEISGYIAVSGDYAYTAGYNDDVNVVDISDPTEPFFVPGSNFVTSGSYGIAVSGNYAYVADSYDGFKVIDISPAWDGNEGTVPVLAGSCDTPNAMDVELSGDYAYVIDSVVGLVIIDVSDPYSVDDDSIVYTIAESAEEIAVRGRYIYAADGLNGFKIIELGP